MRTINTLELNKKICEALGLDVSKVAHVRLLFYPDFSRVEVGYLPTAEEIAKVDLILQYYDLIERKQ